MNDFAKKLILNVAVSAGMTTVTIAAHLANKHVVQPTRLRIEVKRATKELVKETEEFLQSV